MSSKATEGLDGVQGDPEEGTQEHSLHGPWELSIGNQREFKRAWLLKDFTAWGPMKWVKVSVLRKVPISVPQAGFHTEGATQALDPCENDQRRIHEHMCVLHVPRNMERGAGRLPSAGRSMG